MQASSVMSCRTEEPSLSDKCSRESRRNAAVGFSGLAATAIEGCQQKEANRQPGGQPTDLDLRTRMLLEKPITAMILQLAIPNATVMTVQVLVGLLEVYFVSRLGVDALAGVAPVFPLVSLVLAIAQGAIGGGIVTTVARALGTGRISNASEYAWYAVALAVPLGLATTAAMSALGPSLYGYMGTSGNALAIALSYSSTIFAGATLIWMFNLLMAVVRGTGGLQVPVVVICTGALILVPLSPALIFGAFGYQGLAPRAAPSRCLCIMLSERLPTPFIFGAGSASLSRHFVCQNSPSGQRLRFSVSAECRPSSQPARI